MGIAGGGGHTVIWAKKRGNDSIFTFGLGDNGQLGHGNQEQKEVPAEVAFFRGKFIRSIAAGASNSFVCAHNCVYAFGGNTGCTLGLGDEIARLVPEEVRTLRPIIGIWSSLSGFLTIAWKDNGIFSLGKGTHGQLGHSNTENQLIPKKIEGLPQLHIPYWYPDERVFLSPSFEEDNSARASETFIGALLWTFHPWVLRSVDDMRCDVLSFFPQGKPI